MKVTPGNKAEVERIAAKLFRLALMLALPKQLVRSVKFAVAVGKNIPLAALEPRTLLLIKLVVKVAMLVNSGVSGGIGTLKVMEVA